MPFSPPSVQYNFSPSAAVIPDAPVISSVADGPEPGQVTVVVTVPVTDPIVTLMTLFSAFKDLSADDTQDLFDEDAEDVRRTQLPVAADDTTVTFTLAGLAPGSLYHFRASASN